MTSRLNSSGEVHGDLKSGLSNKANRAQSPAPGTSFTQYCTPAQSMKVYVSVAVIIINSNRNGNEPNGT